MSDPRTAWDLAYKLGKAVIGKERWNLSLGIFLALQMQDESILEDCLRAIPADAAKQIKALRTEIERLEEEAEEHIESAGEQARRMTAGPLRRGA